MEKIRVGISSCLMGINVRYDGGHKLDSFLIDVLGKNFELVPVCPEAECGLGVPRNHMHLEGDPDHPRLIVTDTGEDKTLLLEQWAQEKVRHLENEKICGFIFKSSSPSCGIYKVKIYRGKNRPAEEGRGLFAAIFIGHFPTTPVADEVSLKETDFREKFMERVFEYARQRKISS